MSLYNKHSLDAIAKEQGFIRDNLEKVMRLVEILGHFHSSSLLSKTLVLKGGTAINLTVFHLPRLSVDIDLDFCVNCSREEMLQMRQNINEEILLYMESQGYRLSPSSKNPHTLDSWVFNYTNAVGNNDGIKVEINYSNRCHVLPVIDVNVAIPYLDDVVVRTLSPIELFATKINALIGRGAARDIYDVYNMVRHNMFPKAEEKDLLRKTILFYLTVGSSRKDKVTPIEYISFPQIDKVRFPQIRSQLLPVLKRSENFDFEAAKTEAKTYLTKLLTLTDEEKQYVENFNQRKYSPELLFPNSEIIERIKSHPMALWKTGIK
ncbi:MAG: nucleotidyl transferase AbiEii/AbiGii toxin family protein [Bacteroidales bacterium]|nr:nucleotidyl transferase AbiEii/AbiGii toxin family protein [Bacteroidales bacterium]